MFLFLFSCFSQSKISDVKRFFSPKSSKIREIKFYKLLNRAVKTDSFSVKRERPENRIHRNESFDETIVSDCIFEKLNSLEQGGSIYVCGTNTKLFIKSTAFTICYAINEGGAIYYEGYIYNISNVCFLGCISKNQGQAMYMTNRDIAMSGVIISSSILQCGPSKSVGHSCVLFIQKADQTILHINESANNVEDIGACVCIAKNKKSFISYSVFGYNKGVNMFWLHKTSKDDIVSLCNIIGNVLSNENGISTLFSMESGDLSLNGLTFVKNKVNSYFFGGNVNIIGSVFDTKEIDVIKNCKSRLGLSQCIFGAAGAKTRPIHDPNTWSCWALGEPMPKPSIEITPHSERVIEEMSGPFTMFVLAAIGAITGLIGFYFVAKKPVDENQQQEVVRELKTLQPDEIIEK